ncbi:MAG: phosphohistidine phosphatase SixA [Zetaproteobacteria bacterium]|nr:MAG: phosphohistidine phosphatase SixA [Zetaproteobacteria bacterium]
MGPRCYLSQHGRAVGREEDPTRPLSPLGREEIARVAGFLSLFERPQPAVIYCSDKLRARQSAEMFAEAWQVANVVSRPVLAPAADPIDALRLLEKASVERSGPIMLVGHLPHLARLAALLLLGRDAGAPIRFANGGVVCLQQEEAGWQTVWQINPTMFYRSDDRPA